MLITSGASHSIIERSNLIQLSYNMVCNVFTYPSVISHKYESSKIQYRQFRIKNEIHSNNKINSTLFL